MNYYTAEQLKKLQNIELGILCDIDRVCRAHGIAYFIDSGTALGAVRHGGFIPWDDDIDIGMPREDYERFLVVAQSELGDKYVVSDGRKNDRQAAMFTKVWLKDTVFATKETIEAGLPQGIFVDVLPYDEVSDDESVAARQVSRCRLYQSLLYLYHSKNIVVPHHGFLGKVELAVCAVAHAVLKRLVRQDRLKNRFEQIARQETGADSKRLFVGAYSAYAFPRDILFPTKLIKFEGVEFPAPGDLELYLTQLYGDWRTLPPEDKRRQHAPVELSFGENG